MEDYDTTEQGYSTEPFELSSTDTGSSLSVEYSTLATENVDGVTPTSMANDSVENITDLSYMSSTDYYYYYEENEYYLNAYNFEVYILGIARPILVLVTALANIFVVGFFMTKKNRGRATNLLFVSIAFSDTMTGLVLIPNSIHVYLMENDILTRNWCQVYMITRFFLSRVFHTVSIWQTVVLGIQRYMCVCHPFISGRVCTTGKTFVSIVVMYCMAILLHLYHALNDRVVEENMGCSWASENECSGTCLFLWCSVILQHFLPCLILVVLTTITLKELKKANRRVSSMSHRSTGKRSSRDRIITITTTLVVLVFLIPELPYGVYKTILAVSIQLQLGIDKNNETNHLIIAIYELALLVSFHANFWIYCSMMHDFRHAFFKLVTCGDFKSDQTRSRKFSGSTSPRKNSVNRTGSCSSYVVSRNRILSQTTSVHSTASDTVHAVVPLTPSKARKAEYIRVDSVEDQNDDVFV